MIAAPALAWHSEPLGDGVRLRFADPQHSVNLLTSTHLQQLKAMLATLARPRAAAFLLIEGNGRGSFAAGADLEEIAGLDGFSAERLSALGQRVLAQLAALPMPTAALIEGHALGGGFDLALACDLIGATPDARLGHPGIRRGFFTGWGGTADWACRGRVAQVTSSLLVGREWSGREAAVQGWLSVCRPQPALRRLLVRHLERLSNWPQAGWLCWRR